MKIGDDTLIRQMIRENERETNRKTCFIVLTFIVFCVTNEISNLIEYSANLELVNRWIQIPMCVLLVGIMLVAKARDFRDNWIKYALFSGITLLIGLMLFAFNYFVGYLVMIPIMISLRYFDEKFTRAAMVITFLMVGLAYFLNYYLDTRSDLMRLIHSRMEGIDWSSLSEVMIFCIIPTQITSIFMGRYGLTITQNGKRMIARQAESSERIAKVNAELGTAAKIQMSALPGRAFSAPGGGFFVMADVLPAREVGGDFYDYYMVDDNRLLVGIGDVSDKGVPAAMFMMSSRTALSCVVMQSTTMADLARQTNKILCRGNSGNMFVTTWLGLIDIRTGQGQYINCGHNMPYIRRADGRTEVVSNEPDIPLGLFEDGTAAVHEFYLAPGDVLLLYTDGVTDAMNDAGEAFGTERLEDAIRVGRDAQGVLQSLQERVRQHAGQTRQFDDMTVLALERKK